MTGEREERREGREARREWGEIEVQCEKSSRQILTFWPSSLPPSHPQAKHGINP